MLELTTTKLRIVQRFLKACAIVKAATGRDKKDSDLSSGPFDGSAEKWRLFYLAPAP